jgi:hypothetical protein
MSVAAIPQQASEERKADAKEHCQSTKVPDPSEQSVARILQALVDAQHRMMSALMLPKPQVPTFTGDPLQYDLFTMAFNARIVPFAASDSDKLYYLYEHLDGEPRELISSCFFMGSGGYKEARRLLSDEYGDRLKVSMAYMKTVLSHPNVRTDDAQGMKDLSILLTKCYHAMKSIKEMTVMEYVPNLQAIVGKLPEEQQQIWRERAHEIRKEPREPSFQDIMSFVSEVSEAWNHPVYGFKAMNITVEDLRKPRPNETNFATQLRKTDECILCHEDHDLDECHVFRQKSMEEKRKYIMNNRLCFACYGTQHVSKDCPKKRTCKRCGKPHPTAMHLDDFRVKDYTQPRDTARRQRHRAPTTDSGEDVVHPIVPVIAHQGADGPRVHTYALIDNGSSACFITDKLKRDMTASSKPVNVQINTTRGTADVNTEEIIDVYISNENDENLTALPPLYVTDIPTQKSQIPRPEFIPDSPEFRDVQLAPYMPEVDLGLIIGVNCPQAALPLAAIPNTDPNGPFAVQYRHGWTLSGPVNSDMFTT